MNLFSLLENSIISESEVKRIGRSDRRRLSVTLYLCILWCTTLVFYAITDVLNKVYYALPAYAFFFLSCSLAFYLLKTHKYVYAKILLFISGVLIVFYASMADPKEAGTFFLFLPISMCPFAMLDFKEVKKIILLNGLVIVLFLVSFFGVIDVSVPTPSESYVKISFVINFLISILTSSLILYFLIKLNFESEQDLIGKEQSVLNKNDELEKVNKELDQFVYSVSHDLRSPLSSILGIINLAKYTAKNEELKEYLYLIEGRIKAQDDFIKSITDYSRNVRVEITKEKIEIYALVKEVIDSLRFLPGASSVSFEISIDTDFNITTDKLRLQMVLNNLVSNAIKYSDPLQKKAFIKIGASLQEEKIILYVKDNGIGIATEWLSKIFDMFTRATELSTGSGLGLFITKEAVEKLGGTISVESKTGEGSIFLIHLPQVTH